MRTSTHSASRARQFLAIAALGAVAPSLAQAAPVTGWNQEGGGTFAYTSTSNWVGGSVNGIFDSTATLPVSQTITFGTDTILTTGLTFLYAGNANQTLRGDLADRTITLGGDVLHNTVNSTRAITFGSASAGQGLNVDLGGVTRTFTVGSGRTLGFVNAISNGSLVLRGGTINMSGTNTYSGTTAVRTGNLSLNGSTGSVANSDVTVYANNATTSLTFSSSAGSGITRTKSVALNGVSASNISTATLSVSGNASNDTVDTITNALTFEQGFGLVSLSPNASRNARLHAGSLVREAGTMGVFRGTSLGANTLASGTDGAANISFDTAPDLVGGGGADGTTTVSILKGFVGDTTSANNGFSATGGLGTYSTANGVRVLGAAEYATSITDAQTALTNVKLSNGSGAALTTTLNSNTTVNSLSLLTSALNSPVSITGTGALKLNSGTLYAWSSGGATSTSTMSITNTLDLNENEGVIFFSTIGSSNGSGGALLSLQGVISNDDGNGLTIGGMGGVVQFEGALVNTYTGPTTVNMGGNLRLARSTANASIVGDLVVNGGTVQNTGSQLSDDTDVYINGGSLIQKGGALNSGSGASDTFRDLFMTGGTFTAGASGTSAGTTNIRNAELEGGTVALTKGHKFNASGAVELLGGAITVPSAQDSSRFSVLTLDGGVTITNPASGAYQAINLSAGTASTVRGGELTLASDLTFVGNGTNASTATINADAPTTGNLEARFYLSGTRTFNIGNGAALVDFKLNPNIQDGASAGGITKTGSGTLLLTGASTYTGPTAVSAGTLIVGDGSAGSLGNTAVTISGTGTLAGSGAIAGSVAVDSGGTLSPGNSPGLQSVGSLALSNGGNYNWQVVDTAGAAGTAYDSYAVTGTLDLSGLTGVTPFHINLWSLASTGPDVAGNAANFDNTVGGSWTLVATPNLIADFNPSDFTIHTTAYNGTSGFSNALAGGTFAVALGDGGTDLVLTFTPVPEPASLSLLGLSLAGLIRRRRTMN